LKQVFAKAREAVTALLPIFKEKTGIDVKVVAQGTGQALDTARRGDADVVFVHARSAEERFLSEGFGVKRYPVMYNDFVLIGPQSDPAGVKGKDIVTARQSGPIRASLTRHPGKAAAVASQEARAPRGESAEPLRAHTDRRSNRRWDGTCRSLAHREPPQTANGAAGS
jgi:hypothetical protein